MSGSAAPDAAFLGDVHARLAALSEAGGAEGGEAAEVLRLWPQPQPARRPSPQSQPACEHLPAALALGAAGPERALADGLARLAPLLRWTYGYPPDPRWPGLEGSIAFTDFLGGGTGLWPSERLLLGFTLIAPHTAYPAHLHPAIELYLVVAGTAAWQLGGAPAALKPPGAAILHPSGASHAMITGDEPLLALFTWRGDLNTSPVYVA
jgi:mannose-6-phosphate isomerase-like protein (cupin superfamily)